jgi:hypothetical protein
MICHVSIPRKDIHQLTRCSKDHVAHDIANGFPLSHNLSLSTHLHVLPAIILVLHSGLNLLTLRNQLQIVHLILTLRLRNNIRRRVLLRDLLPLSCLFLRRGFPCSRMCLEGGDL